MDEDYILYQRDIALSYQLIISVIKIIAKKILAIYYYLHTPPLISDANSKVIAWPGFMGFHGGVFNPGAISLDSEIIVLTRGEKFPIKERQYKTVNLKSCSPLLLRYSNDMVLKESRVLSLENYPTNNLVRVEDFRLFKFKASPFVNHSLTDTSSWMDGSFYEWQNKENTVAIA